MSDSAFLRSSRDETVPWAQPPDEEWPLLELALLSGLAHTANADGMIRYEFAYEDIEFFLNPLDHRRARWFQKAWQAGEFFGSACSESERSEILGEMVDIQTTISDCVADLVRDGRLEWITDDGNLYLRVNDLESVLASSWGFNSGTDVPEYTAYSIEVLAALRTMDYRDYLQSAPWKKRRARHLQYAGNHCQLCNSAQQPLHVHHRTYERRGFERTADLTVLCAECHESFHKTRKVR